MVFFRYLGSLTNTGQEIQIIVLPFREIQLKGPTSWFRSCVGFFFRFLFYFPKFTLFDMKWNQCVSQGLFAHNEIK